MNATLRPLNSLTETPAREPASLLNSAKAVIDNQARALETYTYHIVLSDGRAVDRQGAATSVLIRGADGRWRIAQYHSSSRAITPPT